MHLLVASDKFAGTLSAVEVAEAITRGWVRADPGAVIDAVPLADGGPGFIDVLHTALGGVLSAEVVVGPLGAPVEARLLIVDREGLRTAYVEAAEACGLALGRPSPATARNASTIGVGQLLMASVRSGVDRVVVGVGGTAATDGGRGCLEGLGGFDAWPAEVELVVASDVTATLVGPAGAARLFGPQKGADPQTVELLEQRLAAWAQETGGPANAAGAGAGGGLGYGLLLLGAAVVPGLALVMDAVGLRAPLVGVDLVITGEGRVDASSFLGKVTGGVTDLAREAGIPCVVVAGDSELDSGERIRSGITSLHTLVESYGLTEALRNPGSRLADLAEQVASAWIEGSPPG